MIVLPKKHEVTCTYCDCRMWAQDRFRDSKPGWAAHDWTCGHKSFTCLGCQKKGLEQMDCPICGCEFQH